MKGQCWIDGDEITFYIAINRRRKRTALAIRDDLAVEIRSPYPLSQEIAVSLLKAEAGWIGRARLRKGKALKETPVQGYEDGATILFQGRPLTIRHNRTGDDYFAYIAGDQLHLCLPPDGNIQGDRDRIVRAVISCYSSAVLPFAEKIAGETAEAIGVPIPRIRFGYQKRRFGSCTQRNGIILNIRLAQAPPDYLKYAVVHEVCHLREAHHQKPFWELVESVLPEYREHHANLRKEGMRYSF
ncbi:putative metal-dependent hydrolase [Methanocalculus alkaliphilus]|uniref:M48 family metallopeptidase n=1 Tax=Methanocalculus alkaliphilus TaxID=768730 RepID=UPI0020A16F96|nr:SprT family zinc-dependent metalloprotease [Methanocalculus alkaliphilus]MCP1714925.1 putative metal-dependent hydrolase [Methanocalculus alkaliphilus]